MAAHGIEPARSRFGCSGRVPNRHHAYRAAHQYFLLRLHAAVLQGRLVMGRKAATNLEDGLRVLPFYEANRASVRASICHHVSCHMFAQETCPTHTNLQAPVCPYVHGCTAYCVQGIGFEELRAFVQKARMSTKTRMALMDEEVRCAQGMIAPIQCVAGGWLGVKEGMLATTEARLPPNISLRGN